ncbi:hypothetical protein FHU13_004657 [Methylobacterium sp. R2-1]|nr:hypothetical protein [Methylobacterium sp. R2-1]
MRARPAIEALEWCSRQGGCHGGGSDRGAGRDRRPMTASSTAPVSSSGRSLRRSRASSHCSGHTMPARSSGGARQPGNRTPSLRVYSPATPRCRSEPGARDRASICSVARIASSWNSTDPSIGPSRNSAMIATAITSC